MESKSAADPGVGRDNPWIHLTLADRPMRIGTSTSCLGTIPKIYWYCIGMFTSMLEMFGTDRYEATTTCN